jgi:hypothetical protein
LVSQKGDPAETLANIVQVLPNRFTVNVGDTHEPAD